MKYLLIVLSVVLTAAGLSRPEFAGRAAQLLVAVTTIVVVASLVWRRWKDVAERPGQPFVPPEPVVTSGIETPDVTELLRQGDTLRKDPKAFAAFMDEHCKSLSRLAVKKVLADLDPAQAKALLRKAEDLALDLLEGANEL